MQKGTRLRKKAFWIFLNFSDQIDFFERGDASEFRMYTFSAQGLISFPKYPVWGKQTIWTWIGVNFFNFISPDPL